MSKEKQIELINIKLRNVENEINMEKCRTELKNLINYIDQLEYNIKKFNYNYKKCLILSKGKKNLDKCHRLLIDNILNLNYNEIQEKLNNTINCDIDMLHNICYHGAHNINDIKNCNKY